MNFHKVGMFIDGEGIGDQLQFTSIPENYYKNTGDKIVDLKSFWGFDHNPYVERGSCPEIIIDPYNNYYHSRESFLEMMSKGSTDQSVAAKWPRTGSFLSKTEMYIPIFRGQIGIENSKLVKQDNFFGKIESIHLRHPRLYRYEELQGTELGTVCVHTTGKSEGGTIPDHVIDQISRNYKGYKIYQVGGESDKTTPFINKLGLDLWESAKLIASSQIFIGVNSSMMNIAQCYPRISRKVILIENEILKIDDIAGTYRPLSAYREGCHADWIDYGWQYYNVYNSDCGITLTYKKI